MKGFPGGTDLLGMAVAPNAQSCTLRDPSTPLCPKAILSLI